MRFCISVALALLIEGVTRDYIELCHFLELLLVRRVSICVVSFMVPASMLHSFAVVLLVHCFVCVRACRVYVAYADLSCKINCFLYHIIACSGANCG